MEILEMLTLDADGDVDAEVDDLNTGSSHGDYWLIMIRCMSIEQVMKLSTCYEVVI